METSNQQDARIQRQTDLIAKELKRATNRAYLRGTIAGLLVGLGLEIAMGYDWGSPTTVVIPLEPGTEVQACGFKGRFRLQQGSSVSRG